MLLSVLDQSPIAEGSTGADALHNTLDLARLTDALGYHRYWVAEHHGGPMLAGPSPEVLIGPIAAATEAHPGRQRRRDAPPLQPAQGGRVVHDPGGAVPRAGSTSGSAAPPGTDPLTTFALQRDRRQACPRRLPPAARRAAGLLRGRPPRGPPLPPPATDAARPARAARAVAARLLAAERDLGRGARPALRLRRLHQPRRQPRSPRLYRERFAPVRDLQAPRTAVAAWVLCAPTDEEAQFLATSSRMTLHAAAPRPADRRAAAREGDGVPRARGHSRPASGAFPAAGRSSARPRRSAPGWRRWPATTAPTR